MANKLSITGIDALITLIIEISKLCLSTDQIRMLMQELQELLDEEDKYND